jgi:hypothetical protein
MENKWGNVRRENGIFIKINFEQLLYTININLYFCGQQYNIYMYSLMILFDDLLEELIRVKRVCFAIQYNILCHL